MRGSTQQKELKQSSLRYVCAFLCCWVCGIENWANRFVCLTGHQGGESAIASKFKCNMHAEAFPCTADAAEASAAGLMLFGTSAVCDMLIDGNALPATGHC